MRRKHREARVTKYHGPVTVLKLDMRNIETAYSLRALIAASGLRQSDFAKVLGVSRDTISRMYCGRMKTPKSMLLACVRKGQKPFEGSNPSLSAKWHGNDDR